MVRIDAGFPSATLLAGLEARNIDYVAWLRTNSALDRLGRPPAEPRIWLHTLSYRADSWNNRLRCAAKRIKGGEMLIIATNLDDAGRDIDVYRKRWGIECMFADAKTRGLNLEDTHITDPDKLSTLLVLVALAVT